MKNNDQYKGLRSAAAALMGLVLCGQVVAQSSGNGALVSRIAPELGASATSASVNAEPAAEVEMFVGESRVFPAPHVGRIAVGNGAIMSASALDDRDVLVFANAPGTSSLFIWSKDGSYQRIKVHIRESDTTRIQREVAEFLSRVPNTTAQVVGDKVIVEGERLSDADQEKVAEIAKRYPQVINFTGRVGWEKMVMMDVKVLELPVSFLRNLGVEWDGSTRGGFNFAAAGDPWNSSRFTERPGDAGVPLTFPSPLRAYFGLSALLGSRINVLASEGKAALLAAPTLSTRSGTAATFFAGGEIPYQGVAANGTPFIQFKPYGVRLDITPKVDSEGGIRAKVDTEVSSVDPSLSLAAGPALLSRRTAAEFNIREGETILLSGFIQREQSRDVTKIPWLGDIPILGALFKSERFQNRETELVIMVTPVVVDTQSRGAQAQLQRFDERLEREFGPKPYATDPVIDPGLMDQTPPSP